MSAGSSILEGVEKHKQDQGLSSPGLPVTPGSCRRAPVSVPAGGGLVVVQPFPCALKQADICFLKCCKIILQLNWSLGCGNPASAVDPN